MQLCTPDTCLHWTSFCQLYRRELPSTLKWHGVGGKNTVLLMKHRCCSSRKPKRKTQRSSSAVHFKAWLLCKEETPYPFRTTQTHPFTSQWSHPTPFSPLFWLILKMQNTGSFAKEKVKYFPHSIYVTYLTSLTLTTVQYFNRTGRERLLHIHGGYVIIIGNPIWTSSICFIWCGLGFGGGGGGEV